MAVNMQLLWVTVLATAKKTLWLWVLKLNLLSKTA